jgi:Arc/MetJ-type ribon-helix-helix transcriptional regulator
MAATKEKRVDKYATVRLPRQLLDEVRKLIGIRGFTSEAEVIKQALREYLDECYRRNIIREEEYEKRIKQRVKIE